MSWLGGEEGNFYDTRNNSEIEISKFITFQNFSKTDQLRFVSKND